MMNPLATPAVVLDTQRFIQPLLESQERRIKSQESLLQQKMKSETDIQKENIKSQRELEKEARKTAADKAKTISSELKGLYDGIGQIKSQGTQQDQAFILNEQASLMEEWAKALTEYGGIANIPIEKSVEFNTRKNEIEANAVQAKKDEELFQSAYDFVIQNKAKGLLTNEQELLQKLAEERNKPIGSRTLPELSQYIKTPFVKGQSIYSDAVPFFSKPLKVESPDGTTFKIDKNKWDAEFNDLKTNDPEFKSYYELAMSQGMTEEQYKANLFGKYESEYAKEVVGKKQELYNPVLANVTKRYKPVTVTKDDGTVQVEFDRAEFERALKTEVRDNPKSKELYEMAVKEKGWSFDEYAENMLDLSDYGSVSKKTEPKVYTWTTSTKNKTQNDWATGIPVAYVEEKEFVRSGQLPKGLNYKDGTADITEVSIVNGEPMVSLIYKTKEVNPDLPQVEGEVVYKTEQIPYDGEIKNALINSRGWGKENDKLLNERMTSKLDPNVVKNPGNVNQPIQNYDLRNAYDFKNENNKGITNDLLIRQVAVESQFKKDAVSPAGAKGLAQFMDSTAAQYDKLFPDGFDATKPEQAVVAQRAYMQELYDKFSKEPITEEEAIKRSLAAYNAGPGSVRSALRKAKEANSEDWMSYLPKPEETIPYVNRILYARDLPKWNYDEMYTEAKNLGYFDLYQQGYTKANQTDTTQATTQTGPPIQPDLTQPFDTTGVNVSSRNLGF